MDRRGDERDTVVALDVGGTMIKGALLRPDGRSVLEPVAVETGPDALASAEQLGRTLIAQARAVTGRSPVAAGVAVPGIVDEVNGVVAFAANLGWRDVPVQARLADGLGLPVVLGHDVRAAGLAESRFGAGRNCSALLFVAVGTGIAAALVLDGGLIRGGHGGAGELGHVVVRPAGDRCGCGQHGCVETIASAAAIARRYRERTGRPESAQQVGARAAAGEPAATAVWDEAVAALADGLLVAQSLVDPDTVAVGGGLARSGEQLLGLLRTAVAERITFHALPRIVAAECGYLAGLQGAGLLAFDALTK